MKKHPSYLLLILSLFIFQQMNADNKKAPMYLIADSDGYVNVRKEPNLQSEVVLALPTNLFITASDKENVPSQWIYVEFSYYHMNTSKWEETKGYIYKNRLIPIPEERVKQMYELADKTFSNHHLQPFCIFDPLYPEVVGFTEGGFYLDGEKLYCEELSVYNLNTDVEFFYTGVPNCPLIRSKNEISYISVSGWSPGIDESNPNPVIADLTLRKEENGSFEFYCSHFYPEIPGITQEEIDDIILNYKEKEFTEALYTLLITACNGSREAREILVNSDNFHLDGSFHHEYSNALTLLYYYEESLEALE